MDKVALAKRAVNLVVGAGVTKIVAGIISNNTNTDKVTDKVTVTAAAFALGAVAADATTTYTDAKIDAIVEWWQNNKPKQEETESLDA